MGGSKSWQKGSGKRFTMNKLAEFAVAMRGITKKFPGVVALDGVTLQVRRGEVHAICGENGAGKSTLMKILSGVYQPDAGELEVAGQSVQFHSTRDAEKAGVLDFGLKSILMDGAMLLNMNVFNAQNDGFLVAAVVNTGTQNRNIDAEFTGFEGNMMVFLSETTKLEANWLFLDHEVVSDTMLIDYLNPTITPVAYQGSAPGAAGLTTVGAGASGLFFKSAGYNCSQGFIYVSGCPGVEGYAQSLKGNNLPGSTDESYGISITQDFNSDNGVTSARLSYRYRGEADLSIFNMDRLKIDEQVTMDLLIRYTPNSDDWFAGIYVKNLRDKQHINSLRESSNVGHES